MSSVIHSRIGSDDHCLCAGDIRSGGKAPTPFDLARLPIRRPDAGAEGRSASQLGTGSPWTGRVRPSSFATLTSEPGRATTVALGAQAIAACRSHVVRTGLIVPIARRLETPLPESSTFEQVPATRIDDVTAATDRERRAALRYLAPSTSHASPHRAGDASTAVTTIWVTSTGGGRSRVGRLHADRQALSRAVCGDEYAVLQAPGVCVIGARYNPSGLAHRPRHSGELPFGQPNAARSRPSVEAWHDS